MIKHVESYIANPQARLVLEEDNLIMHIRDADWTMLETVMAHDEVYYGS